MKDEGEYQIENYRRIINARCQGRRTRMSMDTAVETQGD